MTPYIGDSLNRGSLTWARLLFRGPSIWFGGFPNFGLLSVPSPELVMSVLDVIDEYLARRPSPDLHVALHCTHGVNRTGFFACAYLLLRTQDFVCH